MIYGDTSPTRGGTSIRRTQRQKRRLAVLLLVPIITLLYLNLIRISMDVWPQRVAALATTQSDTFATDRTSASYSDPNTLVETTSTPPGVVCTGEPYTFPAAIDLTSKAPGVITLITPPAYYHVTADTLTDVQRRISDCNIRSSVGAYQGYTSYQLSWAYDTLYLTQRTCRITNIRVGLHINQLLPALSTNDTALADRWSDFAANLTTHEAGHITIDTRYANSLYSSLSALGTMECSSINAQAKLIINTKLSQLRAANELYDSSTDHGATQGAIL